MSDTVGLVESSGLVCSMIFAVKALKGGEEAGADAMLLVKVDGTLLNISFVLTIE